MTLPILTRGSSLRVPRPGESDTQELTYVAVMRGRGLQEQTDRQMQHLIRIGLEQLQEVHAHREKDRADHQKTHAQIEQLLVMGGEPLCHRLIREVRADLIVAGGYARLQIARGGRLLQQHGTVVFEAAKTRMTSVKNYAKLQIAEGRRISPLFHPKNVFLRFGEHGDGEARDGNPLVGLIDDLDIPDLGCFSQM